MSAQPLESADLACDRCGMTTDQCLSMREDCCVGCTHYPEPVPDTDVDEVAVQRAMDGDMTVTLNRQEAAEAHRRLEAEGLSVAQIAERLGTSDRNVQRWRAGVTHPITRRGRTMTDTDTIDTLLAAAKRHPAKRVQNAAARALDAVQRVRALLEEDAGKAEVRERVERLQRELAEAKAALRGGATRPRSVPATAEPLPCRNGCGKTSPNAQGRAAHERHCTYVAVA